MTNTFCFKASIYFFTCPLPFCTIKSEKGKGLLLPLQSHFKHVNTQNTSRRMSHTPYWEQIQKQSFTVTPQWGPHQWHSLPSLSHRRRLCLQGFSTSPVPGRRWKARPQNGLWGKGLKDYWGPRGEAEIIPTTQNPKIPHRKLHWLHSPPKPEKDGNLNH